MRQKCEGLIDLFNHNHQTLLGSGYYLRMGVRCTLFSKRSAHENHPNFVRSLGHRPQPRIILILSISLESNLQKTMCQNLKRFPRSLEMFEDMSFQ